MSRTISKRVFLAATRCLTWGRFDLDEEHGPVTPALEWQFWTGNEIGRRARTFLGDGRLLPTAPHDRAVHASLDAIEHGTEALLFEVTLTWRAFVARADALRRIDGGWELIEVKSGKSSPKDDIKDDYIEDIAYTLLVARNAGLDIVRATLVLIDHDYRLDVGPFFRSIDVTVAAVSVAAEFATMAEAIESALLAETPPAAELKFVCKQCPHFDVRCVGRDVPDPLFDIPRISEKAFNAVRAYERISRLPAHATFTDIQNRHVEVIRSRAPWIDRRGLSLLDQVQWPAYYLDFEAIGPALPWFEGQASYDVLPFQYSVHLRQTPDAEPAHHEFLAAPATDWRRDLAENLLKTLGTTGSIIVYSSYEKTQLTTLARVFPDLKPNIDAALSRLFDLEKIFRDGYVHPDFRGRTSIKKVLPALTGDRYEDMEIGDGLNAAAVFALMHVGIYPQATHDTHRARLLAYCKLDTYAMVKLHTAVMKIRAEANPNTI